MKELNFNRGVTSELSVLLRPVVEGISAIMTGFRCGFTADHFAGGIPALSI